MADDHLSQLSDSPVTSFEEVIEDSSRTSDWQAIRTHYDEGEGGLGLEMNYPEQDQARRRLAKQDKQPSQQQQYDVSQWFNYDLDETSFKVSESYTKLESAPL